MERVENQQVTLAPSSADHPIPLAELRKRVGHSQAQLATAMGTTQSSVSRTERQADIHVSTLGQYVQALGGQLRLIVEREGKITEIDVPGQRGPALAPDRREFRVIWQDVTSRALVHVGWLDFDGHRFSFSYTDDARRHGSFSPFPPFPDLAATYRAKELFAFFEVRLISAADPQFDVLLNALGLARDEATPAELLARTPSESPHDTIQVVPEPKELPDGRLERIFLVSGTRHINPDHPEDVEQAIAGLDIGTMLHVVAEPVNPKNPNALQLWASNQPVGWVPDYLLEEVHRHLEAGRHLEFSVARANGSDSPWHLRLLCRMTAAAPVSDQPQRRTT